MANSHNKRPNPHSSATLRWLVIKEYVLLGLVLLSFAFLGFEYFGHFSATQLRMVEWYEIGLGCLFIADFVYEWRLATDKKRYVRHNWFFLLAALPFPSNLADALRLIRLLRIIRLIRATAHLEFARHNHII